MVQRFGDRQLPGPAGADAPDWHARRPSRVGGMSNLLFLLPVPFAVQALAGDPGALAPRLGAAALLLAAAWLTREGLRAEEAWEARPTARRPALPRKALAAGALGLGLALAGPGAGTLAAAVAVGGIAAALHLAAFGLDPMRDKLPAGSAEALQAGRVARSTAAAEHHLAEMTGALARLGDRALTERMARFQANVRALIAAVERDPRALVAARRYLGVYLQAARDATLRFAELQARGGTAGLRADYVALLDDLDRAYADRTRALVAGDRSALDIEIDVLRDRLAREGLRPADD